MRKPTFCICQNKDALPSQVSFPVTVKLISAFADTTQIIPMLYFLNPKFQASSHLLHLYSSVCVRPVRKPHCWFSHEAAHIETSIRTGVYWSIPVGLRAKYDKDQLKKMCCTPASLFRIYHSEQENETTNKIQFSNSTIVTNIFQNLSLLVCYFLLFGLCQWVGLLMLKPLLKCQSE